MEIVLPSFMRVQRRLTTVSEVASLIEDLTSSGDANLASTDRLAVLDLPDAETVALNIRSITALSRSALTERAVESPELLTQEELYLLLKRYWLDTTNSEITAKCTADDQLKRVSPEHRTTTMEQLRLLRIPLYEDINEDQALAGAGVELKRRYDAEAALRHEKELQSTMASFRGPDWARRLLEEEKAKKPWGFAQYIDPLIATNFDLEHYLARIDAMLMFAQTSVRYGDTLSEMFDLQSLDWPGLDTTAHEGASNVTHGILSHNDREFEEKDAAKGFIATADYDNSGALRKKFQMLREHFTSIRDRPRMPQYNNGGRSRYDGLIEGIVRNAFLVIDSTCVSSLYIDPQYADNVWVWAVDPDHDDSGVMTDSSPESEVPQYHGFLRVRLQQLADKFFEARKYRTEVPMSELWLAAQNSRNKAFVSLNEREQQAFRSDRMTGSALGKS